MWHKQGVDGFTARVSRCCAAYGLCFWAGEDDGEDDAGEKGGDGICPN